MICLGLVLDGLRLVPVGPVLEQHFIHLGDTFVSLRCWWPINSRVWQECRPVVFYVKTDGWIQTGGLVSDTIADHAFSGRLFVISGNDVADWCVENHSRRQPDRLF